MAITKCPNGHYYDDALFSECPYCIKTGQQSVRFGNPDIGGVAFNTNPASDPFRKTRVLDPDTSSAGSRQNSANGSGPKTQMYYDTGEFSVDPAAGWLVCVKGPDKGKDFCVITEKTLIGRSGTDRFTVELSDAKISRDSAAAVIAYLPEKRAFIVSPVPAGNLLVRLNNAIIHGPCEMNDNDVIQIGDTALVFISFCNQNFDWEHYEVKFPPR